MLVGRVLRIFLVRWLPGFPTHYRSSLLLGRLLRPMLVVKSFCPRLEVLWERLDKVLEKWLSMWPMLGITQVAQSVDSFLTK